MALSIIGELMTVDDVFKILEIERLPVLAVVLFEKMASMAILLQSWHGRNIEDEVQALQKGMERASNRWKVIGGWLILCFPEPQSQQLNGPR
jgi:hypothetical protein